MTDVKERPAIEVEVPLDPAQYEAVAMIAAQEGRSIADVVHDIVVHALEPQQAQIALRERRRIALEQIRRHREGILARNGGQPLDWDVVETINQMREEQDARNLGTPGD